jgi:hypothetical protein
MTYLQIPGGGTPNIWHMSRVSIRPIFPRTVLFLKMSWCATHSFGRDIFYALWLCTFLPALSHLCHTCWGLMSVKLQKQNIRLS